MLTVEGARVLSLPVLILAFSGCAVEPSEEDSFGAAEDRAAELSTCTRSGVDGDGDGLDDGIEACLLNRHAPVVQLPLSLDTTRPANVAWALARATLKFNHKGCPDETIIALGGVTPSTLISKTHQAKNTLCVHSGTVYASNGGPWNDTENFYLTYPSDTTNKGSSNPSDWVVYGHAYPNSVGGKNLQYWFYLPYNNGVSAQNHEGEWESVIVRLDSAEARTGVTFCRHAFCVDVTKSNVTWFGTNHPVVWTAAGSHASYPNEAECDSNWREGLDNSCETNANYRWFTWSGGRGTLAGLQGGGVVNLGELNRPLNGQVWTKFNGRWGDVGELEMTSGPRTPTYNPSWNLGR